MKLRHDSWCGLNCGVCPIGMATERGDSEYFRKMAEQWGTEPVNLMCTGCRTEMITASSVNCAKRKCAIEKQVESCLQCTEYPCSFHRKPKL